MNRNAIGVLLAVAVGAGAAEPPPAGWSHTLSLGLNLSDGNTEVQRYNASWLSAWRGTSAELRLLADYNYGESSGVRDVDNARAETGLRRNLDAAWFVLANAGYQQDQVADVNYRWILSPGAGLRLLDRRTVRLTVEAGPAWLAEDVGGVRDRYWSLRVAERWELELGSGAKLWQSLEYLPAFDDLSDVLINAEFGAEAALNARVNLRLLVRDTYDRTPAAAREKNDVSVIGGLALKL
ncbi:MAG: DUF481 domain-containing protein [Kiritimatiellae bacterium]|nr:DUF481 domain-containing protein [Kiritimatiellia bacterium]